MGGLMRTQHVCLYVSYVYTYIHTYIHTCIHKYMHTYIHAYILAYIHTYIRIYIHRVPPPPPPWVQKLLQQKRVRDTDGAPNDFVRFLRAASAGNTEEVMKNKKMRRFSGTRDLRAWTALHYVVFFLGDKYASLQRNTGPQRLDRIALRLPFWPGTAIK